MVEVTSSNLVVPTTPLHDAVREWPYGSLAPLIENTDAGSACLQDPALKDRTRVMPLITLPDGSTRQFDQSVTVADVAASIGPGLAKAALAGRVDGHLVDTSFLIDDDAELAIVTERDDDGIEVLRHSCAHLMAQAVQRLFPSAQVTIGPVIEDGFFYDFSFERAFTPDDLAAIEKTMRGDSQGKSTCSALCAFARRSNFAIQRNGGRLQGRDHREHPR